MCVAIIEIRVLAFREMQQYCMTDFASGCQLLTCIQHSCLVTRYAALLVVSDI